MAHCTYCSAPLPMDSIRCDYCGSRNDTDLKGVHYFTTHELESERICPRCGISLRSIDLKLNGRFLVERCDECLGLFFDPNELEVLLEETVTNVFTINKSQLEAVRTMRKASESGAVYIKCPVCATIMNRVNFGTNSGVIIDRCKEHGVWLDGGELRQLFEWMKAGGKLLQKQREEELRKNALRELEREKRKQLSQPAGGGYYGGDSDFDLFGGALKRSDPDLFAIISKAIGSILR
ncbi:MAG: zf-TFIIB domain-containing protein [Desulfuromonadaceae bacterium]|nr:zf-TFIIB domain-containing protein [Desulfuromonadaceae bacterium]MDD5104629.1 zf-TFIIB domain-containing protein [Desulfuromonadaceae bacterium]